MCTKDLFDRTRKVSFMDDFNSNATLAARPQEMLDRQSECGAVLLLEQEKKRLGIAVRRLEDSNIELREALREPCGDPVYKEALGVGS